MKVVLLWLINKQGEILLSKRASNMDSDAGVWGPSVSGKIEVNEEPAVAGIREAQEELGISENSINPIYLHKTYHNHKDGESREFIVYYSTVEKSLVDNIKLEPTEVAAVKWVSLKELKQLVSSQSQELIISSDNVVWKNIIHNLRSII